MVSRHGASWRAMVIADELIANMKKLLSERPSGDWRGFRIVYTVNAIRDSEERLYPFSKNRSKRIEKKLIKRFGGTFRKTPVILRVGSVIYAHPSFRATIEAATTPGASPSHRNIYHELAR